MDQFDRASELEALHLSIALKVRKPELASTGHCLNCEVSVPEGRKYCCPGCREDDELREQRNKRNGTIGNRF